MRIGLMPAWMLHNELVKLDWHGLNGHYTELEKIFNTKWKRIEPVNATLVYNNYLETIPTWSRIAKQSTNYVTYIWLTIITAVQLLLILKIFGANMGSIPGVGMMLHNIPFVRGYTLVECEHFVHVLTTISGVVILILFLIIGFILIKLMWKHRQLRHQMVRQSLENQRLTERCIDQLPIINTSLPDRPRLVPSITAH
jgi:hypothetical protein